MKNKIAEYDVLRVFTLLLVVAGHSVYYNLMTAYGGMVVNIDNDSCSLAHKAICLLVACIYSFHMPLFMALSGALWGRTVTRKGIPTFACLFRNKWRRLMVPMLCCALLFSIPIKYMSGYWQSEGWQLVSDVLTGQILMFGNSNSHLWFLQALFLIFLVSFVIEKQGLRKRAFLFWISLVALSIAGRWAEEHSLRLLNIQAAMQYLLWFYVGFFFEQRRDTINNRLDRLSLPKTIVAPSLYTVVYIIGTRFTPPLLRSFNILIYALLGIAVAYLVCYKISKTELKNHKIITKLSAASLGLYLYSDPLNYAIIALIDEFGLLSMLYNNLGAIVLFLFRLLATLLIAYVIEVMITKSFGKS